MRQGNSGMLGKQWKVILVTLCLAITVACSQEPETTEPVAATDKSPVPKKGKAPDCGREETSVLTLAQNGAVLWSKPLQAVMEMPGHLIMSDKKHKGRDGLPLAALLDGDPVAGTVILTTCSGRKTAMAIDEIISDPEIYTLTINKRGLLKLARRLDENRYKTHLRAIIRIDIAGTAPETTDTSETPEPPGS